MLVESMSLKGYGLFDKSYSSVKTSSFTLGLLGGIDQDFQFFSSQTDVSYSHQHVVINSIPMFWLMV
jgi:hypothetical protein